MMAWRMSPSPDWLEDMLPLARTKPAMPVGREVVDEVLHPGEVGVALGRDAVLPAHVVVLAEPVGVVEGRIGEDVVGAEVGMEVAAEGVGVLGAEVGLDAAQGEVHHGEAAGGGVALLAVDADVADPAAVGFDEFLRLHEHAAGAAAGIVDAALVGREHFDEEAHDAVRRVELAAVLAFGAGELGEEVFVDAAENVLGAIRFVAQADGADEVDEFAEAVLVERRAGVVFGQHAFEARVVALDGDHGVVHDLADGRLLGAVLEMRPAGVRGHPEDVFGAVFVGIFGIRRLRIRLCRRASLAWCSSKVSEMYLRKIRPRTTCLYSAASMLLRSLSAASQSLASKPRLAELLFDDSAGLHPAPLSRAES